MPQAEASTNATPRLSYFSTATQFTFIHEGRPYHISKSQTELYDKVIKLLRSGIATSGKLLELRNEANGALGKLLADYPALVTTDDGGLNYNGFPLPASMAKKLRSCIDEGFGAEPFLKFIDNLVQNPHQAVMENLYDFLEFGKMPIDDEGHFLAYKAVRLDYKDIHSGNYDNSIGQHLSMPAWAVDPDRNQTCSNGFHVCSFDYLPHFANADGHVMVCRVNPKDVVAIPADYNNTKMRTAAYTVIDEYKGYYDEFGRSNVLAGRSVISSDSSYDERPFELTIYIGNDLIIERYAVHPSAQEILERIAETVEEIDLDMPALLAWREYSIRNLETAVDLVNVKNEAFEGADDGSGKTYIVMAHPHYEAFDADADETALLGMFRSRRKAVALAAEVASDDNSEYSNWEFAVFEVETSDEIDLSEAVAKMRLSGAE